MFLSPPILSFRNTEGLGTSGYQYAESLKVGLAASGSIEPIAAKEHSLQP